MGVVKRLAKRTVLTIGEEKGFGLVDTVMALALLGIFGVAFLSATSTASLIMANAEEKVNVDNLARAQMEYTKNSDYITYDHGTLPGNPSDDVPPNYTEVDDLDPTDPYAISVPSGYSIDVDAIALNEPDDGIQEITVTISRDGESLLAVKGYKLNR